MKKFYLSTTDQKIGGVFGGLGEALGIDSNILRILAIPLFLVTGVLPLLVTYLAAWAILPEGLPRLCGAEGETVSAAAQRAAV